MSDREMSLVERLRERLPVCPFDPKAPAHELEAHDPCPVCGDYGDERSKNLCRGADTRVLDEAADALEQCENALPIFERVTRLAHNLASDVPITAEARKHIDRAYEQLAALSNLRGAK